MEHLQESIVKHSGSAQRELISVLGICNVSLSSKAVEKEFVSCFSESSLKHFSVLPIIVTGSNAKLCFALTYCPHHVAPECICICSCGYVYVCECVSACTCVVHAGEHARMAAVWMHCCKC